MLIIRRYKTDYCWSGELSTQRGRCWSVMKWELSCLLRSGGCWVVSGWCPPPVPQSASAATNYLLSSGLSGLTCGQQTICFCSPEDYHTSSNHRVATSLSLNTPSTHQHLLCWRERERGDNRCSSLSSSASLLSDLERSSSWDERAGILL